MTGRTHDLAAFTALNLVFVAIPLQPMTLATAVVAFAANFIGGLAPDLDQSTSDLWRKVRGGSFLGKLIAPILGGHRMISHSFLGIFIVSELLAIFLEVLSNVLLVNMEVVWWAFMIGFVSHIFMDLFTKEGAPLLFPLPINFGIPVWKRLRIKTAGIVEKSLIFPGLILFNAYLFYTHYGKYLDFLRDYLK